MAFNLRKRIPISYFEPEEPKFDEYIYCDECSDYVFEYCAIHGPLLVIPDDKVPVQSGLPSYVPRAALTIPHVFLHLAPSIIPGAGLGVFTTLTLPRGVRFGPYRGQRRYHVDSMYCWQIYHRNHKLSHVVDAADGNRSNWMRYVNCARHSLEQNLLAYQYQGELYYRTIKIIHRHTELMVFYGSEFANALHINLSKYNSDKFYIESTPYVLYEMKEKESKEESKVNTAKEKCEIANEETDEEVDEDKNIVPTPEIDDTQMFNNEKTANNVLIDTDKRFKCDTCHKTYASAKNLREHSLRHLTTWKYICEHCEYKSNFRVPFTRHMRRHTNTYEFNCKLCSYRSNFKRDFTKHCARHASKENVNDNINKYDEKNQDNNQNIALAIENDVNHDGKTVKKILTDSEKSFKCDICHKTYASVKNLKRHSLTHLTTWKYICEHCEYKTYFRFRFTKHMQKHTNTYEFNCKVCFYRSNVKRDFTRHCACHDTKEYLTKGNKRRPSNYITPRQCNICDFKTWAHNSFSRHKALHEGIVYKCGRCNYSNHHKYNLLRHLKRHEL